MQATVHQTIPTSTMVAHLPTAVTRRHQLRDGGVGSEALQVQRRSVGAGPGGLSNLNGSGCRPNGRGGFGGTRSTAKFPTVGHLPILKIQTPVKYPKRALAATLPKKYRMFWPVLLDRPDYELIADCG